MSERRLLTPAFVDNVELPISGERWISDTAVAGFGVRLWHTGSEGKSFAVRLRDSSGRQIRRTYPVEQSRAYRNYLYRGAGFSLGACLDEARLWALDEIDKSKGRLTLAEIRLSDRDVAAERIKQLTLRMAGDLLLRGLYSRGVSQIYLDRLGKLFSNHVPTSIQEVRIDSLDVEDIARTLVDPDLSFGNIRILRAFVSQIFEEAAWFYGPFGSFKEDLSEAFWPLFKELRDVRFPALRSWSDEDYKRILMFLDEQSEWQAANAIALFLNWALHSCVSCKLVGGRYSRVIGILMAPTRKFIGLSVARKLKPALMNALGKSDHSLFEIFQIASIFFLPQHLAVSVQSLLWSGFGGGGYLNLDTRFFPCGRSVCVAANLSGRVICSVFCDSMGRCSEKPKIWLMCPSASRATENLDLFQPLTR